MQHYAHQEWLGYVQPVGLVVSIPALHAAQAHVNRNIVPDHQRFLSCLPRDKNEEPIGEIRDLADFVQRVFEWEPEDLKDLFADESPLSEAEKARFEVVLPEYEETLRPTHVVFDFKPSTPQGTPTPALMLVTCLPNRTPLDDAVETDRHWRASPQAKFERLLRETQVPIGLLVNGTQLRLVYAPRGETSGYLTFNVAEMAQVAGRPIFAGMQMLLSAERLFTLPDKQRLPAILAESRKYQNTVSTQLSEQVLAALYELLRGFQSADDHRRGELLREILAKNPDQVYAGLLTVLMRLVFVLYAEDRDLLPNDPLYSNHYSVTGLFDRLRADNGRYADSMDQRYGAWAQLLTLFRLIHVGGSHGDMRIPTRQGYLFDPDRYPFLEGRSSGTGDSGLGFRVSGLETWDSGLGIGVSRMGTEANPESDSNSETQNPNSETRIPRISDGVIYRVLRNLLILDGERLSYRTLDVEQIGSVYETIMGFNLEVARGKAIAVKPVKSHGAPATVNLETLLTVPAKDRVKWLKERTDQNLTGKAADALKSAATIDDLLVALDKKIDKKVTPNVVPAGSMVFQPSDERRRSGSHYTPRSLTEPIVRTTLKPILEGFGDQDSGAGVRDSQFGNRDSGFDSAPNPETQIPKPETQNPTPQVLTPNSSPTPAQILALKICDPAMGSGAFLVEACRQLADELVKAWHAHDCVPLIPPDEDEVLHARRLVAQRCLYGVDKNPMAVDLAKLSLWLTTLAKDHPFTFVDHNLRCGDSLVGLSRQQIVDLDWKPQPDVDWMLNQVKDRLHSATQYRARILAARDETPYPRLQQELKAADGALAPVRLAADAVVASFFNGKKERDRREILTRNQTSLLEYFAKKDFAERAKLTRLLGELKTGDHPILPFHWEIEFPEVFENGGFDAIVGNPPFAGKNTLINGHRDGYLDWLKTLHEQSHGNADLVAHFFRRAFNLLRKGAGFGLIATNTIGQGDTRSTGLRWICTHGGTIYSARKRYKWPGVAAVVVSVVHVYNGPMQPPFELDGREVPLITAYLFHAGGHDDPETISRNRNLCSNGVKVYGAGFIFDNMDAAGLASSLQQMDALIAKNARNQEVIFPYLGGAEMNESPTQSPDRYVIDFGNRSEAEAREWPDLMKVLEQRVRPYRLRVKNAHTRETWWQFERPRREFFDSVQRLSRVLVLSRVGDHIAFAFANTRTVFADSLVVFSMASDSAFSLLQCRVHECWSRLNASSMKDDLRYTSTDCFETFPFPHGILEHANPDPQTPIPESLLPLENAGREYYEYRAELMVRNDEGLTKTYNRFHDPHERSAEIATLRELHAMMDRAVLDAYGWRDLQPECGFALDYVDVEDESDLPADARDRIAAGDLFFPDAASAAAFDAAIAVGRRRRPWRYRWPDDLRDEVLARLLELNKQRAEEERLAGAAVVDAKAGLKKPRKRAKIAAATDGDLFPPVTERSHRMALLLLRAWDRRTLTRRAFNGGMILMLNDKFRVALLYNKAPPRRHGVSDGKLNQILTELSIDKYVEIDATGHQQLVKIGPTAPDVDASAQELKQISEVKEYFRREAEVGNVTITEENVDAKLHFV